MASIVLLAGVCRHRLSSSVTLPASGRIGHLALSWLAAVGPGAWAVGRPTLNGGPVWLRPVRTTPCSFKTRLAVVTHADAELVQRHLVNAYEGKAGYGVQRSLYVCMFVCLSVCLLFHVIFLKSNATRITKLYTVMVHHESWKLVDFWVERSRSRGTKTLPMWAIYLSWLLASSSYNDLALSVSQDSVRLVLYLFAQECLKALADLVELSVSGNAVCTSPNSDVSFNECLRRLLPRLEVINGVCWIIFSQQLIRLQNNF